MYRPWGSKRKRIFPLTQTLGNSSGAVPVLPLCSPICLVIWDGYFEVPGVPCIFSPQWGPDHPTCPCLLCLAYVPPTNSLAALGILFQAPPLMCQQPTDSQVHPPWLSWQPPAASRRCFECDFSHAWTEALPSEACIVDLPEQRFSFQGCRHGGQGSQPLFPAPAPPPHPRRPASRRRSTPLFSCVPCVQPHPQSKGLRSGLSAPSQQVASGVTMGERM